MACFPSLICSSLCCNHPHKRGAACCWTLASANLQNNETNENPVMTPVQPVSSLSAFDWLNISGNYFSNDFSFSLFVFPAESPEGPGWHFLLLWMRGEEEATRVFLTSSQEEWDKNQAVFSLWLTSSAAICFFFFFNVVEYQFWAVVVIL